MLMIDYLIGSHNLVMSITDACVRTAICDTIRLCFLVFAVYVGCKRLFVSDLMVISLLLLQSLKHTKIYACYDIASGSHLEASVVQW